MLKRALLIAVAAFWVAMMGLLWRAEFGPRPPAGTPVPVNLVWEKILTAPDTSALRILWQGTNIGMCRWTTSVGQETVRALTGGGGSGPRSPAVKPLVNKLELEGTFSLPAYPVRLGLDLCLTLDQDQHWQEFVARLKQRPDVYEVRARAGSKTVHIRASGEGLDYNRIFPFSAFQNPQQLLRELGGPFLPIILTSMGLPVSTNVLVGLSLDASWQAHQDWLQSGHTRLRVYRLDTRLIDRFRIGVYVSPVGEILRVELPGDILLLHETLGDFPPTHD